MKEVWQAAMLLKKNTILVYEIGSRSSYANKTNIILVYETGLTSSYAVETGLAGSWVAQSQLTLSFYLK